MRLFLDLDTRSFIESAEFQRAVSSIVLKRRDHLPVDVQFLRSGVVIGLADGATGKLGLKADKDFNGSFAASDLEWVKSGTGDATTYRFDLNLNTVQINALFAGVPTPSSVVLMLEIEWAEGDLRTSSHTLAVTLENDIVRGDEGVVEEGGPVYPLPGAIELLARKGQNGGYAGLDDSGKVPVAQLPQTGPVLHETPNRFSADQAGWRVGDIIRQTGDSTAPFFTVEVTDPVPGGTQEVVEITALPVPEGQTSGFQFFSVMGTTDPLVGPLAEGPLSAQEHASLIHATLEAFGNGTATLAGEVVTFTLATTSSSSSWIEGPYASLNTAVAGADSFSYSFAVDFYDSSDSAFSAFIGVSGPMSQEGFAQEIANALINGIPFLDVTVEGPVVTATCNFLGESPTEPLFYNPIGTSQLWQAAFTNGNSGVPPGTFLVADLSQLHNAGGYKGIGDTVDFLSGYGAPTPSVGVVGNGYVDLNNGDFYHCSEAGWQFVLNIKGPQGQQGPPGPAGNAGAAGASASKLARFAMHRAFHLPAQSLALSFTPTKACFDGNHLWVTSGTYLAKIDARTGVAIGTYPVSAGVGVLDICFDGANVWMTAGSTLYKINGSTGVSIGSYMLGGAAGGMCFDGTNLWVGHNGVSNLTLSKINILSGAVLATYNIADAHYISSPFSTDGTDLFVPCDWTGAAPGICRVRASSGVRVATHSMPNNFNLNANYFDGTAIWQTGGGGSPHTLFKVNPSTGLVVGNLPDNVLAWPIVAAFAEDRLFVHAGAGSVKCFDKSTLTLQKTYTLSSAISCLVSDGAYIWAGQPSALARIDTVFP